MPAGRPPKYNTPEEMQRMVDLYFLACRVHQLQQSGADFKHLMEGLSEEELLHINDIDDVFPTVTGLALALDLTRKSLIHYEVKEEFVNTVKKAKARVEKFIEQRLYLNNAAGPIFNLKNNFDWKDKQETELSGHLSVGELSDAQLQAQVNQILEKAKA